MKYKGGNSLAIILLGTILLVSLMYGTSYQSELRNLFVAVVLVICGAVLTFHGSYLQLSADTLEYVNLLVQRHTVDVGLIKRITRGRNAIFLRRTYVYYGEADIEKRLVIYDMFSEHTMHKFLDDIKKINPSIIIEL